MRFAANSATGSVSLNFADQPVFREIVNVVATPLAAAYLDGVVQVTEAPRFAAVEPLSGGGIRLTLAGPTGESCVIQASSDLLNWTAISTNLLGNGPLQFVDPAAPAHSQRFYRLVPKQ